MNFLDKIEDICKYIFINYGISENFPNKENLIIHDNVFGTLEFSKYERKIINSPFMQRLTQIGQMGLANYVYPGAVHNRFSHSLGVSYIAEKIYNQVMKNERRSKFKRKQDINTIKLAGLMHDIGHGPFSHVSDHIFTTLPHFNYKYKNLDTQIFSSTSIDLKAVRNIHEFLGFHLLKSDLLKGLINNIYELVPLDQELIPYCITGNKEPSGMLHIPDYKDLYKTLLIKIINGFSDADKIDYLLRDSKFSGLPIPADIDRLISFFKKIQLNKSYELGVDEKGTRAFHLLLQSKAKMFPTVYQHHTTQSFETLLQFGIISAIKNEDMATKDIDSDKWPLLRCGLDLLYYTDNSLLDYLRIINDPISQDVVKRMYNRRHYRKLRRVYTWEMNRQMVKREKEYTAYLLKTNKEMQTLKKEGDIDKYDRKFEKLYSNYTEVQKNKISEFYLEFENRDKIKEFKKKIISQDSDILEKLQKMLPSVDDEILYDYAICIKISDQLPINPFTQPYIKRVNRFKEKDELLSLSEMKFREPKHLDYQQITFYALPEISEKLEIILKKYINSKLTS
jgi:HD superfamily phosphohydrolase